MQGPRKNEKAVIRTEVTDGWEPPYGYWELNLGPLEESLVLLITESSLQHLPCL